MKQSLFEEIKGQGLFIASDETINKAIEIYSQLKGLTVDEVNIICGMINVLTNKYAKI